MFSLPFLLPIGTYTIVSFDLNCASYRSEIQIAILTFILMWLRGKVKEGGMRWREGGGKTKGR